MKSALFFALLHTFFGPTDLLLRRNRRRFQTANWNSSAELAAHSTCSADQLLSGSWPAAIAASTEKEAAASTGISGTLHPGGISSEA